MYYFGQAPFVRLLIPFVSGILSGLYSGYSNILLLWVALSVLLIFFITSKIRALPFSFRWVSGLLVYILLFLSGFYLADIHTAKELEPGITEKSKKGYIGRIISRPFIKNGRLKATIKIYSLLDSSLNAPVDIKAMASLEYNPEYTLKYNDLIICKAPIRTLNPPYNPGEFNYKKYLNNKGIVARIWAPAISWKPINYQNENQGIRDLALQLSSYFERILVEHLDNRNDLSVAKALLLGNNDNFDSELREKYSGAGAMHILCVSGLHVGVIYLLLNAILFFLNRTRPLKWIKLFLLFLSVWSYAFITGASPSVMRAATMLSFIIFGQAINEKVNIYNSLAASAFLLLALDPYMITSVGFQLSYLAVLSIVSIQPLLYKMIYCRFWVLDKAWAITTVSIAAQIGTAPLALYYFHQFPNYFILTNLIVIPLSSLLIYLGITTLLLSHLSGISVFLGKCFGFSVHVLNKSMEIIYDLPSSVSENIYISTLQCILVYIMIFILIIWIYTRWKTSIYIFLIAMNFSLRLRYIRLHNNCTRNEIEIYYVPGHFAIDFIKGEKHIFLADSTLMKDESKLGYLVKGNWINKNLGPPIRVLSGENFQYHDSEITFTKRGRNIYYNGVRIAVFEGWEEVPGNFPEVDYLILNNSKREIGSRLILIKN